ncbi:MAG TPA: hypothetical protein VIY48_11825 [Candidatus Paceibacterota bacterium]
MAVVLPSVTGQSYTDGGRYTGDWQSAVMSPVLTAAETTLLASYGVLDDHDRTVILYPSAARTATPTAQVLYAKSAVGIGVYINATAITSTPSVVVTIDGYDPASATWYNILTSAAIATVSTKRMIIYPTIAAVANLSVATVIPDTIRVVMTHGNANSITYSVGLDWMP